MYGTPIRSWTASLTESALSRSRYWKQLLCGLAVLGLWLGMIGPVRSDFIYWVDYNLGDIRRANLDGSGPETLVKGLSSPGGIALDPSGGQMYWSNRGNGDIQRANLDGSGQITLVKSGNPVGIALDLFHGQMYWADGDVGIRRANLDGSGLTTLISGQSVNDPRNLALDLQGGKIYWTDFAEGTQMGAIRRANLDGTVQEILVSNLNMPGGIALDLQHGLLYWADNGSSNIMRANLDGSGQTTLLRGLSSPFGIALDVADGLMYWGEGADIRRANLDGTGQHTLIRGLPGPFGIALDLSASGTAVFFVITTPASVAAGTPFDVTVTALDPYGNIASNYQGTVTFSSSDSYPAVLPANYTFTPSDQDTHTFTGGATLFTTGTQSLTVQDTTNGSLTGSATVTVSARAISQLVVSAAASATAGSPLDLTVTALDSAGNAVTGYSGTVSFSSSDSYPAVLPVNYTFTSSDQGTHTFSGGVILFTAGAQTLTAQDTGNSALTGSASVAVVAAPASLLQITAPAAAVSGTPFDVILTALDPYANVDMNYAGTVTWTSSDTDRGVLLPADYTFQPTDNGMVTFPGGVMLITLGNQTLTATDTVSGITGSATITIGPGP
jgi:sugar lactone lactonase YvrE